MFAKKGGAPVAALEVKVDSYVLETDVHFPTDLNLLWDAGRKCVDLIGSIATGSGYALPGWRKAKDWRRQLKACERAASQIVYRGGPNKESPQKSSGHFLSIWNTSANAVRPPSTTDWRLCEPGVALWGSTTWNISSGAVRFGSSISRNTLWLP